MEVPEFRWPTTPATFASTSFCATVVPTFGSAWSSSATSSNFASLPSIWIFAAFASSIASRAPFSLSLPRCAMRPVSGPAWPILIVMPGGGGGGRGGLRRLGGLLGFLLAAGGEAERGGNGERERKRCGCSCCPPDWVVTDLGVNRERGGIIQGCRVVNSVWNPATRRGTQSQGLRASRFCDACRIRAYAYRDATFCARIHFTRVLMSLVLTRPRSAASGSGPRRPRRPSYLLDEHLLGVLAWPRYFAATSL